MNEFIKILLSLSVSGSLLLLLIWGLKPLYKNKFSKRWQYYVWIIVALRFLLPFTPNTTIVGSLFEKFDTAVITNEIPASPNALFSVNTDNSKTEPIQTNRDMTAAVEREPFNIYVCLFFIWSALALVLFVRKITVYQGFIQYIKAGSAEVSDIKILNLLSDCQEKLNIRSRVELARNSLITSPIMIGFFRPGIILPVRELDDKELSYIFVHELIHYKQSDMFYKWLIQIVVCVHWFNPFVYLLEKEVNRSCELSCDEKVISILDDNAKREYGDTLISFLKSNNLCKNSLASVTLTEGAEQLKERLDAIMKFRKKPKSVVLITAFFSVAVCICFFVTGAYAKPSAANNNAAWKDSEILNEVLTENGVYYIFCDGAGEDDKPLASVSVGNIMFVLVRKDSYTSIGPFDNMETLMEDVARQCEHMKNLPQEEKELVIETAAKINENEESNGNTIPEPVKANEEVWLSGITRKNEMTIYPRCIFPMSKGDIFYIEYNDSVSGTFKAGLIDENGEKSEAETTIWQEGDTASIEVNQDGNYYFYLEGFNDDAGWFNTTFKFIVSYEKKLNAGTLNYFINQY